MTRWIHVRNLSQDGKTLVRARWCQSFLCRLRGLTFRGALSDHEGLILVESETGRVNTSIHMWMVFFPLGVVWLDADLTVVDQRLARPWGFYFPRRAARFVLEGTPRLLEAVEIGDRLAFDDESKTAGDPHG